MYRSGMKVRLNNNRANDEYPQLVAEEYLVKFSYMTSTYTWVVLHDFPDQIFNAAAFIKGEQDPFFAVKTIGGGLLISDIEYLDYLASPDQVLDYKELQNMDEMRSILRVVRVVEDLSIRKKKMDMLASTTWSFCRSAPNAAYNILR